MQDISTYIKKEFCLPATTILNIDFLYYKCLLSWLVT